MRVANFDIKAVISIDDIRKFLSQTIVQIVTILNGKITFSDNFDGRLVSVTFSKANTDMQVAHNLNRTVSNYIVTSSSVAMSVYNGQTPGDNANIFLRSNTPGSVTLLVF